MSAGMLMLGACSNETTTQIKRLAMPVGASNKAPLTYDLWRWAWLAAILVGILVWGLIGYSSFRFRRRSDDEVPVQVRYNLPIEILYTIAPIVMVLVFFFFTVQTQNKLLATSQEYTGSPSQHTIHVVGQQWSWTFNYVKEDAIGGKTVHTVGTPAAQPTLYLPADESVKFVLTSPDVIHDFWVPAFLFKMDVIPGHPNSFSLTPTRVGTYQGRCAELCGVYHSRMLFNVKVVSPEQYDAHLRALQKAGQTGLALGGSEATKVAGLTQGQNTEVQDQDTNQNGDGS
jgi:cytochrome c oxidase subunit 2